MSKVNELREERQRLIAQAQEILKKDKLTPEEEQKFDALMKDADALQVRIERHERADTAQAELNQKIEIKAGKDNISVDEAKERSVKQEKAYKQWMRFGIAGLRDEERAIMSGLYVGDPRMGNNDMSPNIRAAQGVGSGGAGGYTVPDEMMRTIVEAMKEFGGMRQVSTAVPTSTGADLPIPTDNDTASVGEIINENSAHNEGDITFGQVILQSFLYSSKIVRVSRQLLQDSTIDLSGYLGRKLGMRIGRIQNTHFTTGDGSSKPRGVVAASVQGGATTASATAITYEEIVDLMHSVDPAYQPASRWMLNFATLGVVRKLKDSANMPIWAPLAAGVPDTLLGKPYTINQDLANVASAQKPILYGAFSNYHIRDAGNVVLLRLEERYAEFLQVAFLAFLRSDGDLVDAGTNPVKFLLMKT